MKILFDKSRDKNWSQEVIRDRGLKTAETKIQADPQNKGPPKLDFSAQ